MPRSTVKVEYIEDEYARKTSFMKRKTSVMKKLNELCTLCSVEACAIIYSEYEPGLEVWPNNIGVQYLIDQFMLIPEVERSKTMVNHDSYLRRRISKIKEHTDKYIKENRDKKIGIVVSECLNGEKSVTDIPLMDLQDMMSFIDDKLSEVDERLEFLKGGTPKPPPPSPPPPPQPKLVQPQADVGGSNTASQVVEGGVAADGYVPVVENPGDLDGIIPSTEWFTDWEEDDGLDWKEEEEDDDDDDEDSDKGDNMMNPHANDPNTLWWCASSSKPN